MAFFVILVLAVLGGIVFLAVRSRGKTSQLDATTDPNTAVVPILMMADATESPRHSEHTSHCADGAQASDNASTGHECSTSDSGGGADGGGGGSDGGGGGGD